MTLNGVANFINLSTATGPNSIGLLLPPLGTASSSTTSPGWSFEFVWKPLGEQNTWAKLADFGNGASSGYYPSSNDDWTLGFDGNDQTEFLLETYNAGPGSGMPYITANYTHGWTELQTLVIGQWSDRSLTRLLSSLPLSTCTDRSVGMLVCLGTTWL